MKIKFPKFDLPPRKNVLLATGLFYILIGLQVVVENKTVNPGDAVLYESIPTWLRASMWTVSGSIAIFGALFDHTSQGWAAVIVMPIERLVSFLWSFVMWLHPGEPPGTEAYISILQWIVVILAIYFLSKWDAQTLGKERAEI